MSSAKHYAFTALLVTLASGAMAAAPGVVGSIKGADAGWDYASVDPASNRLFVARADGVMAVDLASGAVTAKLAAATKAHAVLPIPGTQMLLVTDGTSGTVALIDKMSGAELHRIPVGLKPDAAIWDAALKQAVIMNAKSGTVMLLDPATAKVIRSITLAEGLEFAALDSRGHLFVNNEDRNSMYAVDLGTGKVLGEIKLTGCEGPTGLAYAPWADRMVASCANGVAALVDPRAMKTAGTLAIGRGPDAVIPDTAHRRLYIPAGGDGDLAVIDADARGRLSVSARIPTAKSARTGAFDPATGKLYLPSADYTPPVSGAGRGTMVPGSFRVLIVATR